MSTLIDWLVQNDPDFRKTRLPSLYSDLTVQKTSNPEGYAANVTAWKSALTRAALAGQLPSEQRLILQTNDELLNALASLQYGRPSGLGSVIDECVRNGKMIDLKDFMAAEASIYHRSWIPSPWAMLRWSLRQAGLVGTGSYDISGQLRRGNLVLVGALEEVSKQVLAAQAKRGQSVTDRVLSREAFTKELASLGGSQLSDQDTDVLLRFMARDKQSLSYDSQTIKFKSATATTPDPITTEDSTIASIKTLITNLTLQISSLSTRITSLQSNAQSAVKQGNKQSALSALRSKKLAEKTLQQRNDTLTQLEEVYTSIEAAVSQLEIVSAMEASAGVLKSLNRKVGGVERVEDIVDDLWEQMGQVDEVGQVIREPLDGGKTVLDEDEVDDELEEMEKEERTKIELEEKEKQRALEAVQAEATRKRLDELEKIKEGSEQPQPQGQVEGEDLENSTTQKLKRLSIEDVPTTARQADDGTIGQQAVIEAGS